MPTKRNLQKDFQALTLEGMQQKSTACNKDLPIISKDNKKRLLTVMIVISKRGKIEKIITVSITRVSS